MKNWLCSCCRSLPLIDTDKLFINEKRLREEHRRITQRLSEIQLSDQAALRGTPADQQMQIPSNKHFHHRLSQHPHLHPSHKPYVSRTYIGGSATSSLALKIQRSKHQQNMNLNGSLSSLHETSLNSGRSLTIEISLLSFSPKLTYLVQRPWSKQSDVLVFRARIEVRPGTWSQMQSNASKTPDSQTPILLK